MQGLQSCSSESAPFDRNESVMDGKLVLRRGCLDDLQALTDLSVQAFEPGLLEAMLDALNSALGLANHRSAVEGGLRKRLLRASRQEEGSTRGNGGEEGGRAVGEGGGGYELLVAQDSRHGTIAGMVER